MNKGNEGRTNDGDGTGDIEEARCQHEMTRPGTMSKATRT